RRRGARAPDLRALHRLRPAAVDRDGAVSRPARRRHPLRRPRPGRGVRARRRSPRRMKQMTRRERIRAALNREPVDRVPYAGWRHFPAVDKSPAGLAQATLRFHERYGSDFLKITPAGGYAVEAWGCVEGEDVRPDGHRACARCAVRDADAWKTIRALDPDTAPGYAE